MTDRNYSTSATTRALDLDPESWPAAWRSDWNINDGDGSEPRAWHCSGLCFFFEFEQIDEHGNWSWIVYDDDISQSRLFELHSEMGEEAFHAFALLMGRQAKTLWRELGHADFRLKC